MHGSVGHGEFAFEASCANPLQLNANKQPIITISGRCLIDPPCGRAHCTAITAVKKRAKFRYGDHPRYPNFAKYIITITFVVDRVLGRCHRCTTFSIQFYGSGPSVGRSGGRLGIARPAAPQSCEDLSRNSKVPTHRSGLSVPFDGTSWHLSESSHRTAQHAKREWTTPQTPKKGKEVKREG